MNASISPFFVLFMYKILVLSPGLTVKSLSRSTSLKRTLIELIEVGDIGLKRERSSSLIKDNGSGDVWC